MVWHTGLELFTPVSINAEPIQHLLDEYARQNYEPIDKWIHSKTQELQYVGVLVSHGVLSPYISRFSTRVTDIGN